MFSLHLQQSLLIHCGYGSCCCIFFNFISTSSLIWYFKSQILPVLSPTFFLSQIFNFALSQLAFSFLLLLFHPALLFFFILLFIFFLFLFISYFNFSLSYPGFHSSLLKFSLTLLFQNHFPFLQTSLKLFFLFPLLLPSHLY